MKYTPGQRHRIISESKGKVIKHLKYDEDGNYWVMTFTDGSEMSFRFMAESWISLKRR